MEVKEEMNSTKQELDSAKQEINSAESKPQSVVAITVTFNRTQTLEKNIKALRSQNYPLLQIIIADNGSNEEHREKLKEITAGMENITILWLGENRGGAGGFEAGMAYARDHFDPDWYWIMDDDAYPRKDTLEKLLEHRTLPKLGALLPLIYGVDRKQYQLYHAKVMCRMYTGDHARFGSVEEMKAVEEVEANAFVGPLFPRSTVQNCGIADGGLFIYGDDTEYTVRIHQKYKLYVIKNAVIDHNDPPAAVEAFSPRAYWKLYYMLRNSALLAMKYNKGVKKIPAFFYITREMLFQSGYSIAKRGLGKNRFLRLKMVLQAYFDGIRGKKGKTVDPVTFAGKIK